MLFGFEWHIRWPDLIFEQIPQVHEVIVQVFVEKVLLNWSLFVAFVYNESMSPWSM